MGIDDYLLDARRYIQPIQAHTIEMTVMLDNAADNRRYSTRGVGNMVLAGGGHSLEIDAFRCRPRPAVSRAAPSIAHDLFAMISQPSRNN